MAENRDAEQPMSDLFAHKFTHQGFFYVFKWAKRTHVLNQMPNKLQSRLTQYFQIILDNKVPNDLFNDKSVQRCSTFRLTHIKHKYYDQLEKKLDSAQKIQKYSLKFTPETADRYQPQASPYANTIHSLLQITQKRFDQNALVKLDFKPNHEEVLNAILLQHDSALTVEVPIWTRRQTLLDKFIPDSNTGFFFNYKTDITGHIDLILYDAPTDTLIIADYKPEGEFLRSLPQIASYGLLIKHNLKILNIKCLSFNRDEAWLYDPEILREDIQLFLIRNGYPKQTWQSIIAHL